MKRAWLVVFIFWLAGCTLLNPTRLAPGATPLLPEPPTVTPPGADEGIEMIAVWLRIEGNAGTRPELASGTTIQLIAEFNPVVVTVQRRADGGVLSTSWQPWQDHPAAEMRYCLSLEGECLPQGGWQSFAPQIMESLPVSWLGERTIFLAAEFRDAQGSPIPAGDFSRLSGEPGPVGSAALETIAFADPAAGQTPSPQVLTAVAKTAASFPVTGSVELEDGRCCAGGTAGGEVELTAVFTAESPAGKVTGMRVSTGGGCRREAAEIDAPWEPFAAQKSFTTTLALNWVGFYVNVQFRDETGNLSPVYCDDISLEGSPAQTP